jgi:HSP20 family protein
MERDENGSIRDFLRDFITEHSGGGKVKLQSELTWEPQADVAETADEIIVVVDLAGMKGDDIRVVTDGKVLKISGFRKSTNPKGIRQFYKVEIPVGPFERTVELPSPVDHSQVSARYDGGLLKIRIPKADDSRRVRKVRID